MIGIGIVIHNDLIDKREEPEVSDPYKMLLDLIRTIDLFTQDDYILIIRDNYSLDFRFQNLNTVLNREFDHIKTIFVRSDINELTDAWNQIITMALNSYNCNAVTILNQDILLTKYWQNFVAAMQIQSRDMLSPLTSNVTYQPFQQMDEEDFDPDHRLLHVPVVQGFCFGASKRCLEENMYDSTHYFDPEIQWRYNEEEWQQRNNKSGGKSLIVLNSYIIHLDKAEWNEVGLYSTKELLNPYKKTVRETIYGTINYKDYLQGKYII